VEGKAVTCREQERRTGSKDKIRNTQSWEIVGANIREQRPRAYFEIKTSKYIRSGVGKKVLIFVYVV
jgi:hypothetical protein